jgi:capsid protein
VRTRLPEISEPIGGEKSQQIEMSDGMVYDLQPGEDLKAIDASSPNPNAIEFTKDHQRQIAKGLKISAYQVTGDLRDANYGSIRVGLLQDQLTFNLERRDIATDFCVPIYRLFMDLGSLSYLRMPGDFEVNNDTLNVRCSHIYTSMEDIKKTNSEPVIVLAQHIGQKFGIDFRAYPAFMAKIGPNQKGIKLNYNDIK